MSRYKSSETRGVMAKSYCYFIRQYSCKKLRVRKIYAEHCKENGSASITMISDLVEMFTTTHGYLIS